ncbi:MAG: hypothetical protein MPJ50_02075 [Pirellulales bacterium]|nr:hypothetical protein [Pirellulales bacterium]
MKKKRYTEEQIAFALWQAESGTVVSEIIRKMRALIARCQNDWPRSGR